MAKTTRNEIKLWFLKNLFPTQQQFHNLFDSYFHLDDEIPQESIKDLADSLTAKVDVQSLPFVVIDGFQVVRAGKADLLNFEVNDKFDGWDGDTRVAGKIIQLPVVFPADLYDKTKVKLALKNKI